MIKHIFQYFICLASLYLSLILSFLPYIQFICLFMTLVLTIMQVYELYIKLFNSKINELMNNLFTRVNSETPSFFKKLRNIALTVASVCAIGLTLPVGGVVLSIIKITGAVATAVAGTSQLTTKND